MRDEGEVAEADEGREGEGEEEEAWVREKEAEEVGEAGEAPACMAWALRFTSWAICSTQSLYVSSARLRCCCACCAAAADAAVLVDEAPPSAAPERPAPFSKSSMPRWR